MGKLFQGKREKNTVALRSILQLPHSWLELPHSSFHYSLPSAKKAHIDSKENKFSRGKMDHSLDLNLMRVVVEARIQLVIMYIVLTISELRLVLFQNLIFITVL